LAGTAQAWSGYGVGEEIANAITHGVGALLSFAGLALLVVFAAYTGDGWKLASACIYGLTLALLYLCSTLYHALPSSSAKNLFRILDHASIYLLIAGSYTPFLLIRMRTALGMSMMAALWGLSAVGIVYKSIFLDRHEGFSTAVYLAMGWMAVIAIGPMFHALGLTTMMWIGAGGVFYSGGVFFFISERRYSHAVWHLFVLGGSLCHFVAILFFTILK